MSFDLNEQKLLLQTRSYREFLKEALQLKKQKNPRFSQALFAKKAGFSSRSYPGDVIRGQKDVTYRSLPKVIFGLGLKGSLSKYFELLVELEHPDVRIGARPNNLIEKELEKLRQKFANRVQSPQLGIKSDFFNYFHRSLVYAALGSRASGVTFGEVVRKTRLDSGVCLRELEALVKIGAAEARTVDGNLVYRPIQSHLVFTDMQGHQSFEKHMLSALKEAETRIDQGIRHETDLFFHSVLSFHSRDAQRLKLALREALTEFICNSEESEGDSLTHLVCAFFGNHGNFPSTAN
jgi:hypothetical protein